MRTFGEMHFQTPETLLLAGRHANAFHDLQRDLLKWKQPPVFLAAVVSLNRWAEKEHQDPGRLLPWPGRDLNPGREARREERRYQGTSTKAGSPRERLAGQKCWQWRPAASQVSAPGSEGFTCERRKVARCERAPAPQFPSPIIRAV